MEDAAVPVAVAEEAAAKLKAAQFVKMAGTAHNPYMDKPEEFSRAILEFLTKDSA
jgi:pimeloyl-ACP methyl ester carboxylesterase